MTMEANASKPQVYRVRPTGGAQKKAGAGATPVVSKKAPSRQRALPPLKFNVKKAV